MPGVGPGGYVGCIRLTLRYNRATRRATGFFARDVDGGRPTTIGTLRGISPKLGSRKKSVRRPAAKAKAAPARPAPSDSSPSVAKSESPPGQRPNGTDSTSNPHRRPTH